MTETKRLEHPFELKKLEADGSFSGYGSVFHVKDSYADIVAPGAFKRTLKEHKRGGTLPAMLWQHNAAQPIGAYTMMREDEMGLYVEGQLAVKTTMGSDVYELMKMKAVSGLSIGYITRQSTIDDKKKVRTLIDVDLLEVSLVTFPANTHALVQAVKAAERIKTIREFEDFLRDVGGFSVEAAKRIASSGFKSKPEPRDEAGEVVALLALARKRGSAFLT
jgi:HK97 family phage prohead protease